MNVDEVILLYTTSDGYEGKWVGDDVPTTLKIAEELYETADVDLVAVYFRGELIKEWRW